MLRHEPEGGPIAFALGQTRAKFEAAVFLAKAAAGLKPGRCVVEIMVELTAGDDMQKAVPDEDILWTRRCNIRVRDCPTRLSERLSNWFFANPIAWLSRRWRSRNMATTIWAGILRAFAS
jgi:hypothetical protein